MTEIEAQARGPKLSNYFTRASITTVRIMSFISSPRRSNTLTTGLVPSRIALADIIPNRICQANAYVSFVEAMGKVGNASEEDLCEAERYRFEATAAYCLQNDSALQTSAMDKVHQSLLEPLSEVIRSVLVH